MACYNKTGLENWLPVNLSEKQRTISAVAGGALLALGVLDFSKSSFRRAVRMTIGTLMLLRAKTGYCPMTAAIKGKAGDDKNLSSDLSGYTPGEPVYAGG